MQKTNDVGARKFSYPDKKPFMFGTAFCRKEAPLAEVEEEIANQLREILPDGWIIKDLIPGAIFFQSE